MTSSGLPDTRPGPDQLVARVLALRPRTVGGPVMLGITGAPGAGKTTLAAALADRLAGAAVSVACVPMDGFHLADVSLRRLGRLDVKGASETFDPDGYVALLRRVRDRSDPVVWAPAFDRLIEQPVAGSIAVAADADVVLTEGNYLLAPGPWTPVREVLDEIWYVRAPEASRLVRLTARHVEFGKSPSEARSWVARVDGPNAALVESTAGLADLTIDVP